MQNILKSKLPTEVKNMLLGMLPNKLSKMPARDKFRMRSGSSSRMRISFKCSILNINV